MAKRKKILFLGAAHTQVPPIRYARAQGHYIITCDYLPKNPGHKYADEYFNVSTTDREGVLKIARNHAIDAIVAYASDPAAPIAAYVAEKMSLPGNPYEAVCTMADKSRFRKFLKANGFNAPRSQAFDETKDGRMWFEELGGKAFVKPVDSSGSKGVALVEDIGEFDAAFAHARSFSIQKKVIIEEPLIRQGFQVAGDGFVIDGQLAFRCWADEHFDKLCNGLVPIGQTFPSVHPEKLLSTAHSETQRLLNLLGMRRGALNFDFLFNQDDKLYFLEIGPRNGGCQIPEVIQHATGVDLIKATVDTALDLPLNIPAKSKVDGFWSSYVVHALEDGSYRGLQMSERIKDMIVEQNIWADHGQQVFRFSGSNHTLGSMILRYPSQEIMLEMIENMERDIRVITG